MPWLYKKHVVIEGEPESGEVLDVSRVLCPHCRLRVEELNHQFTFAAIAIECVEHADATLVACANCGWWLISVLDNTDDGIAEVGSYYHLHSVLETCDVSNVDGPADELQRYLIHRYNQRFEVRPHVFEDVVGQVFRNHGFQIEATARSNDGGIDLFVGEKGGSRKAVQVKRYAGKIEAAFIREFAGALVLGGHLEGIFVTTSGFTRGAVDTAERYRALRSPVRIDLWDAERFFTALNFRTGSVYTDSWDDSAPFYSAWTELLRHYENFGSGWIPGRRISSCNNCG